MGSYFFEKKKKYLIRFCNHNKDHLLKIPNSQLYSAKMSDNEDIRCGTKFLESAVFWSAYDRLSIQISKIELRLEELSPTPNPNSQRECLPENVVGEQDYLS